MRKRIWIVLLIAVIVVLADKSCATAVYDGSLALGNLMLAAHALVSISFENPWYLLLIPVAALFLLITQRFMFTREKGSKVGQIVIRAILFLILIFALSGFSLKFTGKSTTTIYLLDVSDSVRDSRQDITKAS